MRSNAAKSIASLVLCLGVALVWTSAQLHWHPTAELWQGFIFRDAGHVLTIADTLLGGGKLYQDIFYQYGPLPIYCYFMAAAAFGNSPATLLTLQQMLSLVVVALAYRLLNSALSRTQTVLFLTVGLFPLILLPGSTLADFSGLDYVSWERILLLVMALAWKPPPARTTRYAVTQGALLGLLQLVKFGSAFVAGAALLLVDLFYFRQLAGDRSSRRKWLTINLTLLAVFAVMEGGWIAGALAFLPQEIARDILWPYFMVESYASYVIGADRWPRWQNAGYFVVAQLPAIAAFFLFAYSVFHHAWKKTSPARPSGERAFGGFAFLAAFFLIGLTIYFRHVWHIYQYLWMITLAAGWAIRDARLALRAALLALWMPAFALSAKTALPRQAPPDLILERFPNGDKVWLEAQVQKRLAAIHAYLLTLESAASREPRILLFPDAGGLHHFFNSPPQTRFFWFTGSLVQGHDEGRFLADFSSLDAVVVFFPQAQTTAPVPDPLAWSRQLFSRPAFGEALNRSLAARLAKPVMIDERCWVFPVSGRSARLRAIDAEFLPRAPANRPSSRCCPPGITPRWWPVTTERPG